MGRMDKEKLAIVYITHRRIDKNELHFLNITNSNINNLKKYIFIPEGLDIEDQFPNYEKYEYNKKYFKNINSYNELLMSKNFYLNFLKYEYILILQPDCIILKRGIEKFCTNDIKYIGASFSKPKYVNLFWISKFPKIGHLLSRFNIGKKIYGYNGGLSIRNVDFFINIAPNLSTNSKRLLYREDIIFSYLSFRFQKYNRELSDKFCLEEKLKPYTDLSNINSYCLHDPQKYNSKIYNQLIEKY